MADFSEKKVNPTILIVAIFVTFGLGFYIGKNQVVCQSCPPQALDFSLFWNAYYKLQEKFVDKAKFDNQKLIYGAIDGMVKSLEDPYTVFFSPEEGKKFRDDVKGTFEGIGAEIGVKKGQLQVIAPLEGSPAQKAGLQAGDKIIKINDTFTVDLSVDQAVDLIRGKRGTEVVLTIFREGWEKTKEIKIIRELIEIPSLKLELVNSAGKANGDGTNIAYLKLFQFSEKANTDFRKAALEIINSPAQKIILDLRGNPGGYLEVARDIAGWFLERDQVVVVEKFGNDKEDKKYLAEGNSRLLSYPMVILINNGSASASEILAGALRDNRGIKLIGENSFGKGSVQELEELKGGSSLKITIARWFTPKDELITDKGLKPDIEIKISDEQKEKEKDPQLEKALEIVQNL